MVQVRIYLKSIHTIHVLLSRTKRGIISKQENIYSKPNSMRETRLSFLVYDAVGARSVTEADAVKS